MIQRIEQMKYRLGLSISLNLLNFIWEVMKMALSDSLQDKLLKNTGFFEGNDDYSTTTGNFDGQGLSFGIIQYNFGQETLQPLLKDYINNNGTEFNEIFGNKADTLRNVILNYTKTQQITWGDSISDPNNKYIVIPEWKTPFMEMGSRTANQELQKSYATSYFSRAESLASRFGIISTQGLAFLFDQAVHEWSFSQSDSYVASQINYFADEYYKIYKEPMPDFERLGVCLDYVRTTDGRNRRAAIRDGSGVVHGKAYNINEFGLSYSDLF